MATDLYVRWVTSLPKPSRVSLVPMTFRCCAIRCISEGPRIAITPHVLVRGGDAERRRVVVGPEMRRHDAAAAFLDQPGQRHRAPIVEDRVRRLDHELHPE